MEQDVLRFFSDKIEAVRPLFVHGAITVDNGGRLYINTSDPYPMCVFTSYEDSYNKIGHDDAYCFDLIQSNYESGSNMTTHICQMYNDTNYWFAQLKCNYGSPIIQVVTPINFQQGYSTISDRRLKEDIKYLDEDECTEAINKLKPCSL